MLRYLTAGESHGKALIAILEGMPAGVKVDVKRIDAELGRRQSGYGRGDRMKIESDRAEVLSGLRRGETIGSPITIVIRNNDATIDELPEVRCPRPGHADLAGALKYGRSDMRDILERASARETASRVAIGALCGMLLAEFDVKAMGHVIRIGSVEAHTASIVRDDVGKRAKDSPVMCADRTASKLMCEEIDRAKAAGDTLGGVVEIVITGLPAGLGSHVQWDRRLDSRFAAAVMSIQAIKGVEIGAGFQSAGWKGSETHDPIMLKDGGLSRPSNNAGGLEGGITNGEPVIVRAAMKPISTLMNPLDSVDISTGEKAKASVERSDICAVPAAAVVAENVCAFVMADALLEKFGGDCLADIKKNRDIYIKRVKKIER